MVPNNLLHEQKGNGAAKEKQRAQKAQKKAAAAPVK
ncbi:hypothetical protein NPIL_130901, partial [Nephila pilipes]